jgi:hypothetical protein
MVFELQLSSEFAEETREAILDEIKNMLNFQVGHYINYDDIEPQLRSHVVRSFMFIKHKYKADGKYDKTKARLVGDGSSQNNRTFQDIYSATVALALVFILFNIATYSSAIMVSYDIKGAFLNAHIPADHPPIYMLIDKRTAELWTSSAQSYLNKKGELIILLDRFIYGLKQSPLMFKMHLTETLKSLGYEQALSDECIFIKKISTSEYSILSTHVDDVLQVATHQYFVDELKEGLIKVYNDITFHPEASSYLGMNITRSSDKKTIQVNHVGKIQELLKTHLVDIAPIATTPATDKLCQVSKPSEINQPLNSEEKKKYLSIVMSLMYIARLTRPDILLAVTFLSSRSHCAHQEDIKKLQRVLRYLKGTMNKSITINCTSLQLNCHCDASFALHSDGLSHTGYFILFWQ